MRMFLYEWIGFLSRSLHHRRKIRTRAFALALLFTALYIVVLPNAVSRRTISHADGQLAWQNEASREIETKDVPSTPAVVTKSGIDRQISPPVYPRDLQLLQEPFTEPAKTEPAKEGYVHGDGELDIETAVSLITSHAPDEIRARELLRPLEGTGETKLRELGLRTRAFKTLFEAWESLHLFEIDGNLYRRENVVRYLRKHRSSAANFPELLHKYDVFRHFMTQFASLLFPWIMTSFPDHMSLHASFYSGARGIVLTAGDGQAPYLLTSISSFRRLGCDLPIEILYLGEEDLGEDWRIKLESLPGVVTRDLGRLVNDESWKLAGWAAKPFAILMSSFREVLFVDADALFFVNPEQLFNEDDYLETGALFFKDRSIMPESKKKWLQKLFPSPVPKGVRESRFWTGESGHMQESGVMVVDKWKHFVALLLVTRMNGPDRDGSEENGEVGVYEMVYGDKETYWLGWELVGDSEYSFHQGAAGIMGAFDNSPSNPPPKQIHEGETRQTGLQADDESSHASNLRAEQMDSDVPLSENYTLCAPQLLHLDKDGRPLWFNGWILSNKFADGSERKSGTFQVYMKEPRTMGSTSAWNLEENNICCMTAAKYATFSEHEASILDMITSIATEVGVVSEN